MKRWAVVLAAAGLLVGAVGSVQADRRGGDWRGGGHWHGGHGGVRTHIYLGLGAYGWPYWDPFWYPAYPYPYYYAPPTVVVSPPPATTYIQPETAQQPDYYWYYCTSPKGYYPYVKRCPQGWLKVVPQPSDD
jgi:hypothetical protein